MKIHVLVYVIFTGVASVASYLNGCSTYYVISTEAIFNPGASDCDCQVTIKQLLLCLFTKRFSPPGHHTGETNLSNVQFLFRSGTHLIEQDHDISPTLFLFKNISTVIMHGESDTIIRCTTEMCLSLSNTRTIKIANMHFRNCSCYSDHVFSVYSPNISLVSIEIVNSRFTNSNLRFDYHTNASKSTLNASIKDTIIENCSKIHSTFFYLPYSEEVNIILQNITVRDNNSSFLYLAQYVKSSITFTGYNSFTGNKDFLLGTFTGSKIHFSRANMFICRNVAKGSSLIGFMQSSTIAFVHSHIEISNNQGSFCCETNTSLPIDATIIFKDNTTILFYNNNGTNGGALSLDSNSILIFNAKTLNIIINFINNTAQRGGAIFVNDSIHPSYYDVKSIFSLQCSTTFVKVTFSNNKAYIGGTHVYGGFIDWLKDENGITSYNLLTQILYFEGDNTDSAVASDPIRICPCVNNHPYCNITSMEKVLHGYTVSLDLVAVGQRFTPVQAHVKGSIQSYSSKELLSIWPRLESLQSTCTRITYKFYSQEDTLLLTPFFEGTHQHRLVSKPKESANDSATLQALTLFEQLSIALTFKKCPLGFVLQESDRSCSCHPSILLHGLKCDFDSYKICRTEQQWIGLSHTSSQKSSAYLGVIVHQYCPRDYCRRDTNSLLIQLGCEDELCAFNRSGILCGSCKPNFSRLLGSSKCQVCTNNPVMLAIILSWLLSGLMLVILLVLLDLTVSVGTINGLTFYANIVRAQHSTFFTHNTSYSFLGKFIAWINLDQGIELCLHNGLDDFGITWLHFFFPVYVWLIALVLIISSHYSKFVSKLTGKNIVQVLATLFLITYARLLQLIIDVFSFTTLVYPDGNEKKVWLIDGNVEYLRGKHIALFLVTVIFVMISLPYTLILLTIQFLYKISHCRAMFWIQRLKPFFDAYTGPYRANHRYWTGLLLVVRIILLVVFSVNQSNNPSINLFTIIIVSIGLVGWLAFARCVYLHPLNNILEIVFLCNLCITSAAVLFDKGNTLAIHISVGSAVIVLAGIVLYHIQRQILVTKLGLYLKKKITVVSRKETDSRGALMQPTCIQGGVTSTVVELKESLLADEPEV